MPGDRARWGVSMLVTIALLAGCQPSNPPPTPLPTKEKTIDKVKSDIDKAMKQADDLRKAAEDRDSTDQTKKGS